MSARWFAAVALLMVGLLGAGCASQQPAAQNAPAVARPHGNATVRSLAYYAAWVDERARPPAAVDSATPAASPTPADKRKARGKRKPALAPSASREAVATAGRSSGRTTPQPRYEYTVELDSGGYQTLVGQRDLGIRVNDRVLVQGSVVAALPD